MIKDHVRLATLEDIPEILKFAKAFMKASPYRLMTFDPKKGKDFLTSLIDSPLSEGVVLLALKDGKPVGFLVGVASQPVFSSNKFSMELGWWVEPEHRGCRGALLMYAAYEDWAKRVGCSHIQGAYLPGVSPDLDKFYKKRGYVLTESSYVKVVKIGA